MGGVYIDFRVQLDAPKKVHSNVPKAPTQPWINPCLWVSGKGKKNQKRRIKENREIKKWNRIRVERDPSPLGSEPRPAVRGRVGSSTVDTRMDSIAYSKTSLAVVTM
jgi:hypothetical protein